MFQQRRWLLGLLLLGLAVHAKITALLLLPIFGVWLLRHCGWRRTLGTSVLARMLMLPMSWLLYAPYGGWATLPRMLQERHILTYTSLANVVFEFLNWSQKMKTAVIIPALNEEITIAAWRVHERIPMIRMFRVAIEGCCAEDITHRIADIRGVNKVKTHRGSGAVGVVGPQHRPRRNPAWLRQVSRVLLRHQRRSSDRHASRLCSRRKPGSKGFQIGALLAIPAHALETRAFAAAGFTDLRPAHTPVFQLLQAAGTRVTDLAARPDDQASNGLSGELFGSTRLSRTADPRDGRAQLVRRTARGWAVNRLTRRVVEDIQQEWTEQLGAERVRDLRMLLADLAQIVGVPYAGSVSQLSSSLEQEAPNGF